MWFFAVLILRRSPQFVIGLTVLTAIFGTLFFTILSRPFVAVAFLAALLPFYNGALAWMAYHETYSERTLLLVSRWKELLILMLVFGARRADFRRAFNSAPALDALVILYIVTGCLYIAKSPHWLLGVWGLRIDHGYFLIYLTIRFMPVTKDNLKTIMRLLTWSGLILALAGFYQVLFLTEKDLLWWGYGQAPLFQRVPDAWHRAEWGFLRPGLIVGGPLGFGAIMMIIILMTAPFALFYKKKSYGWLPFITLVLCGVAMILTTTRGAWLGTAVGVPVIGLLTRQYKKLFFYAFFGGAAAILLIGATIGFSFLASTIGLKDGSSFTHASRIMDGIELVRDTPIGHGMGTAGRAIGAVSEAGAAQNTTESWYFQIVYEMGWAGLGLFLLILLETVRVHIKVFNAVEDEFLKLFTAGSLAAFLGVNTFGVFLHAWSEHDMTNIYPMMLVGLVVFHVRAADERLRARRKAKEAERIQEALSPGSPLAYEL
ncbi:MAG: O-antigen ligase family protein [Candidatus Methylomirabilis sp.]|nr:O-antigen ligase family protein [Deltaproteobacteria bacterium]